MAQTSTPVIKREINAAASWLTPAPGFLKYPVVCAYGLSCTLYAEFLKRTHNFCNMTPRNQF